MRLGELPIVAITAKWLDVLNQVGAATAEGDNVVGLQLYVGSSATRATITLPLHQSKPLFRGVCASAVSLCRTASVFIRNNLLAISFLPRSADFSSSLGIVSVPFSRTGLHLIFAILVHLFVSRPVVGVLAGSTLLVMLSELIGVLGDLALATGDQLDGHSPFPRLNRTFHAH